MTKKQNEKMTKLMVYVAREIKEATRYLDENKDELEKPVREFWLGEKDAFKKVLGQLTLTYIEMLEEGVDND